MGDTKTVIQQIDAAGLKAGDFLTPVECEGWLGPNNNLKRCALAKSLNVLRPDLCGAVVAIDGGIRVLSQSELAAHSLRGVGKGMGLIGRNSKRLAGVDSSHMEDREKSQLRAALGTCQQMAHDLATHKSQLRALRDIRALPKRLK